jgi:REP element-mobilizing transposase RayT
MDLMKQASQILSPAAQRIVDAAIRTVCSHRDWALHALNVRTNHVHLVVTSPYTPERTMTAFKAWTTRRLREGHIIAAAESPWSRHGSTKYLWDERSVTAECDYTNDAQDD